MSGPPDKWVWFPINDLTGDQIGEALNDFGKQGFTGPVLGPVLAKDGEFVYVGGYIGSSQTNS